MSRRRWLFLLGVTFLAFMLQVAVLPNFKLFGVQPDLILVVAVVVAVVDGPLEGAVLGFFGGILRDVVGTQILGMGALTNALVAYAAGILKDLFMTYTILLPALLVFFMSLLEPSLRHAGLILLGQEELAPFQVEVIFISAVYNVLLVFIVYPVLRRFRFARQEESPVASGKPRPTLR